MAAFNPLSPQDHAEHAAHEPSMEEILASIRRIISDDQSFSVQSESDHETDAASVHNPQSTEEELQESEADPREFAVSSGDDIIEAPKLRHLNEEKFFPAKPHPIPETALRHDNETFPKDLPFDPGSTDWRPVEPRGLDAKVPERKLVLPKPPEFASTYSNRHSDEEGQKPAVQTQSRHDVESANYQEEPLVSPETNAAVASSFNALFASRVIPTPEMLQDMAREMLRPMLKAWLDDNLPVMVERLVRAEIERVARGGR